MKAIFFNSRAAFLFLLAATGFIFSSFSKAGGEGFEIFVDNKVVMQRFGQQLNTVQQLLPEQYSNASKLTIRYHHCGRAGKNKVIVVKDDQNNVLRQWRFRDAQEAIGDMSCHVQEIIALKKSSKAKTVSLVYTSSELPNGRTLVNVSLP